MTDDADVLVVGAGIAGAALANALGQLGLRTIVVEKGARRDTSTRGDVLHPPSLAFLEQWGALAALRQDGAVRIRSLAVSHRELGLLARYPIPNQSDAPAGHTIATPHDRIEHVLRARATTWPSVAIEDGEVTDLVWDGDGRVVGARVRRVDGDILLRAGLVVGCDGVRSVVRRLVGIQEQEEPYSHELLYVAAEGVPELPESMHYNLSDRVVMVVPRPRNQMRIAIRFEHGERGDLLRRPDPALREFVVSRIPALAETRFGRADVHVYRLTRLLADRFVAAGAALAGDAAHSTHPTGSTGMSLAICGVARLVEQVGPVLTAGVSTAAGRARLDAALQRYDAERRPAAAAAIEANHRQAQRLWGRESHADPHSHAAAANPAAGWGPGGGTWGYDPAGLGTPAAREPGARP